MSHHSDTPMDEDMSKYKEEVDLPFPLYSIPLPELPLTKEAIQDAGATGKFPQGKLTEEDKGEIAIKIGTKDGKVIMDFGKEPINWIGMTPEEALALGKFLFEKADAIKYGS